MTVIDDNGLRNITPLECERLQTVPDNYTNVVADTNRYTMLGNGWTVDVIAHIFLVLSSKNILMKTPRSIGDNVLQFGKSVYIEVKMDTGVQSDAQIDFQNSNIRNLNLR